ncbi:MAG: hypothetical protein ABMB14_31560 [Myxococcota bacterium]
MVLSMVLAAGAWAGDDKYVPDDGKDVIVVEKPEAYEELMRALISDTPVTDWPNWPSMDPTPQLLDGTTQVKVRDARIKGAWLDRGEVFTTLDSGTWTEQWIVSKPTGLFGGTEQSLPYAGGGFFEAALPYYNGLSDVADYGVLTFQFEYHDSPPAQAILFLPTQMPTFIGTVYRFDVRKVIGSTSEVCGSLYRQKALVNGADKWYDSWVLYSNFEVPHTVHTPDRELLLVPIAWNGETLRAFLQREAQQPQKWYVQASSTVAPVPPVLPAP